MISNKNKAPDHEPAPKFPDFGIQLTAIVLVGLMAQQTILSRKPQSKLLSHLPSLMMGVYRHDPAAEPIAGLNSSHTFIDLADSNSLDLLRVFLLRSQNKRVVPMVTLEPFPSKKRPPGGEQLLFDMRAGVYDSSIDQILSILKEYKRPVLLRFAHEMDAKGLYPWSYSDGRKYVALYDYVFQRALLLGAKNILWVWSPQGRDNADQYWPGRRHVDLVGVSIYASIAFSSDKQLPSFESLLNQRLWIARRYSKPFIVAEVGVSANGYEQQQWLHKALASLGQFSGLRGFFYFQEQQPAFMPLASGHEDWRLPPVALSKLSKRAMEVQP
jgi:hypothetical protein